MKLTRLGALTCALFSALVWTAAPALADEPISYTDTVTLPNGQTVQGKTLVSPAKPLPVNATVTANATINALHPTGTATLSLTTTSARVALPSSDPTALIRNTDATHDAEIKFGDNTVVAATTDVLIPAGQAVAFNVGASTYVAGIVASGTGSLHITTGTGLPALTGGGSGGGSTPTGTAGTPNANVVSVQGISGGTPQEVNAISNDFADGAIVTLGNTADAAWSGTGGGSEIAIQKAIRNLLAGTLTVNLSSISTAATASNQSSEITQLSNLNTVTGTTSDTAWTGTGAASLDAISKAIWSKLNGGITVNFGTIGSAATASNQSSQITQETASATGIGTPSDAAWALSGNATLVALGKETNTLLNTIQSQSSTVKGTVASGSSATDPPVFGGCRAATTVPSAVSDGQVVATMCSKAGKPVVELYGPSDLQVDAGLLTVSTTTETSLQAAGAAGVFNDMTRIKLCNTNASTAVRVDIRDATAGTVVDTWQLPANDCRGQNFSPPLRQTTAANAWTVQLSGAVTDVRIKAGFMQRK